MHGVREERETGRVRGAERPPRVAYRIAIARATFEAETAADATETRPPTSVPSIVKKRRLALAIGLV